MESAQTENSAAGGASALTDGLERGEFEHWYSDGGRWMKAVERSANGSYKLMGAAEAWRVWQAATRSERDACALICHERYMELEHGTSRDDPADDWEAGLRSAIAEELRDQIMARSNAELRGRPLADGPA